MFRWFIAIYLRLSSDDKIKGKIKDESNSISNQKIMILNYLKKYKDIKVYKIYIDDGYTGTDFDRPGFQEMMEDIESGKVNAVIVKDLSRLGRDYIGVGDFIEKIMPRYNLRFISINDHTDSYLSPKSMNSLEISFKSLMNDNYAKDTSNKMKSSLKASKEEGNFIGQMAPFGYIKDKDDCHKLIIDDEASKIIKKIFDMAIEGKTRQEIIYYLNFNHILTPSVYMNEIIKCKNKKISQKWSLYMLDSILKNEKYTGTLVQGRFKRINHKTHNIVRCAEDEWIITESTHKPIISKKIFEQVQNMLYGRNCKVNNDGQYDLFNGYLKCADCGCNMNRNSRTKKNKKIVFYYCGKYHRTKECTKHYILEKEIEESILELINQQISLITELDEILSKKIVLSNLEYNKEMNKIKIENINKEIKKYEILLNEVTVDFRNDYISKQDYESYNISYLYELNNLKLEKERIENNIDTKLDLSWIKNLKKLGKLDKLDKKIITTFIDDIFIYENRSIRIDFNYTNQYNELIKYLKMQKCVI